MATEVLAGGHRITTVGITTGSVTDPITVLPYTTTQATTTITALHCKDTETITITYPDTTTTTAQDTGTTKISDQFQWKLAINYRSLSCTGKGSKKFNVLTNTWMRFNRILTALGLHKSETKTKSWNRFIKKGFTKVSWILFPLYHPSNNSPLVDLDDLTSKK